MTRIVASKTTPLLFLIVLVAAAMTLTDAFVVSPRPALVSINRAQQQHPLSTTRAFAKKKKEDLSYLETRDMTKEEMLELNKKNEDIMNMELSMMTGFSLAISLPLLYLLWVAFFSE